MLFGPGVVTWPFFYFSFSTCKITICLFHYLCPCNKKKGFLLMSNTIKLFFFIQLISLICPVYSQEQSKRDSILLVLESSVEDSIKIKSYNQLVRYYLKLDVDSALYFANKGLVFAQQKGSEFDIGRMYRFLGHGMVVKDSLDKAKEYYLNAIQYIKRSKKPVSHAGLLLVLGNIYFVQNNYPEALNHYIAGEKISDSLNIKDFLSDFYNNLGAVYFHLKDYPLALENFDQGLRHSENSEDRATTVSILTNMSDIYVELKDYEHAKELNNKALQLVNDFSVNEAYKVSIYNTQGDIEYASNNYDNALLYYKKAIEVADKISPGYLGPLSVELANCRVNLGKLYFDLEDFDNSLNELNIGYGISKGLNLLGTQKDAALYLSKLYDSQGELKRAFDYYKIYNALSDSISNENSTRKITQLKMQFEFDKTLREQEVEQARKEMLQRKTEATLYVIIGGVLLGLLIFILLFLLQKNKSKRIHLEQQNLKLDLESRNKELTTNVMYLLKKNEFIESISDKLKLTKLYFKPENRIFVDNIIKELEDSLSQNSWEEFEMRFQQVHTGFYKSLTDKYPDLTSNDLKLCAFLRLNMSTKEISAITYQSYNTLSTARYRLRKKLDLDDHANLISFLNQV